MTDVELVLVVRKAGGLIGIVHRPGCWRLDRAVAVSRIALADPSAEVRYRPCSTCLPIDHRAWWERHYHAVRPPPPPDHPPW